MPIVGLLLTLAAVALGGPEFTGTWVFDLAASDFGMSPPPDSAVTVIERADDRLILTRRTFVGVVGPREVHFDLPIDGNVHDGAGQDTGGTPAIARWDGDALVFTVYGQSNVGEIEITDTMTVSGSTMTIVRSLAVPGMLPMKQTLVLRRRE